MLTLPPMRFRGTWRHHQTLALDAFDRDRASGSRKTHLIVPPAGGKTLIGLEIIARIGAPAAVFVPNSAIQGQWPKAAAEFGLTDEIRTEVGAPVSVLTYQSLCQLDDPGARLSSIAAARWNDEQARATGQSPAAVAAAARQWPAAARKRRSQEITRITASLKREIARGQHPVELAELLAAGARQRLQVLIDSGVRTIVLDESHHLASMWGYIMREVIAALGADCHVIGLTATGPSDMTADEQRLYEGLLGEVDYTVPTPAVVRDGFLAPYQELVWLCEPLDSERQQLAEREERFQELLVELETLDPDEQLPTLGQWICARVRDRDADGQRESWPAFQRRAPELARAGMRWLAASGLALPADAPRGEAYEQPVALEDWLVLLGDYALRCLKPSASPLADKRSERMAAGLRELGYLLTRTGIRRGPGEVDRVLGTSAAKCLAAIEILHAEAISRGVGLRALVLTDALEADARRALSVSAQGALAACALDVPVTQLYPLLVSGKGLECLSEQADWWVGRLANRLPGQWRHEDRGDGRSLLIGPSPWQPSVWTRLATAMLTTGDCQLMIGTRGLLGEGWDAPCVNCLIDLTTVAADVSTRQMRGRSLRLDPRDPNKLASNWDVVCVAPQYTQGAQDYRRFARKHEHLLAPCEDGAIEAGPSHVHPALSPFAPPQAEQFASINAAMLKRAGALDAARERWALGSDYRGEQLATLVVSDRTKEMQLPDLGDLQPLPDSLYVADDPTTGSWGAWARGRGSQRVRAQRDLLAERPPLERVVRALTEALVACDLLSPAAAASAHFETRPDGYVRVVLTAASESESALFADALQWLCGYGENPRYLVARAVFDADAVGALGAFNYGLARKSLTRTEWHAIPKELARNKHRRAAFLASWRRWVGPAWISDAKTPEGARNLAQMAAAPAPYRVAQRQLWV